MEEREIDEMDELDHYAEHKLDEYISEFLTDVEGKVTELGLPRDLVVLTVYTHLNAVLNSTEETVKKVQPELTPFLKQIKQGMKIVRIK